MPPIARQLPEPPGITMVSLAAAPQQKNGMPAAASLPAMTRRETDKPLSHSAPVQAVPPAQLTTRPAARQNLTVPEAPPSAAGDAQQDKHSRMLHQTPAATDSGHAAQPAQSMAGAGQNLAQDMTFGSASGPSFRKQTAPVYPAHAKRRGKEGSVLLRLSISETGHLTHVEVLEDPGHGFAEAALEAVRNSSFSPAHHNGKPVAAKALLPIRFTLH